MARLVVYGRSAQLGVPELAQGARALGLTVAERRAVATHGPADVIADARACVVVGIDATARRIAQQYQERGVQVFALDYPRLRVATDRVGLYEDANVHALPLALGHAVVRGTGRDVPKGKPADPAVVLVAAQVTDDAAHGMTLTQQVTTMLTAVHTVRVLWPRARVIYRQHPNDPLSDTLTAALAADIDDVDGEPDPFVSLTSRDGTVLVAYNSGIGWDAIQAGVPVVHIAPAARCAWSAFGVPLGCAVPRRLTQGEATVALMRAASCDFSRDELASGDALDVLLYDAVRAPRVSIVREPDTRDPLTPPTDAEVLSCL